MDVGAIAIGNFYRIRQSGQIEFFLASDAIEQRGYDFHPNDSAFTTTADFVTNRLQDINLVLLFLIFADLRIAGALGAFRC